MSAPVQALLLVLALFAALLAPVRQGWAAPAVSPGEWGLYKEKFLDPAGRIVDNANGGISHSEGQGYGLLLSYLAGNRGDFDRIWAFTRVELLVRDDGLAVWKWDPGAKPHISDTNNATDGDLLIAYALALAGEAWHRPDLTRAAADMAAALAAGSLETVGGRLLLKPGNSGFAAGDRADGPVVNPSYWVFEALPVMAGLAPNGRWNELAAGGKTLLAGAMKIGPAGLPPDWVSLKTVPAAAEGFPREFGYNALRIPLYLMRAGIHDRDLLAPFLARMPDEEGRVRIVDIATGQTRQVLADSGYRIIPALVSCVLDGKPLAEDLRSFEPTDYYPATLQLLALAYARLDRPGCL